MARRPWVDYLVVLGAAVLLFAPVLAHGMPYGHDGATYAAWVEAFAHDLADGTLYPRWLSSMGAGAGSPAFFFYPPLASYLMAGVRLLVGPGPDVFAVMAIGLFPLFAASGLSFLWAARPALGRAGALAGAVAYLVLPYHYGVDLWFRGDAAEFAGYAWAPLAFGFLLRLDARHWRGDAGAPSSRAHGASPASGAADQSPERGRHHGWLAVAGLALSFALMTLTHLPTALILAIGLSIAALWRSLACRDPHLLVRFAVGMALGIALCGIYLVPALTLQDMTSMHRMWAARFRFDANFLFTSSDPNMPPIQTALAVATGSVLLPAAMLLGRTRPAGLKPLLAATACVWFAMTPLSAPLWDLLPPLQKVQFPWRFGILLDLALAGLAGLVVAETLRRAERRGHLALVAMCLGILLANLPFFLAGRAMQMPFMDPPTARLIREAIAGRRDTAEYLPPTAAIRAPAGPAARTLSGDADVNVTRWRSRDIALRIEAGTAAEILVRHHHVRFWKAALGNGRPLPLSPATDAGLISFSVPPGTHIVSLRFPFTAAERWGLAASLAGATGLALVFALPGISARVRRRDPSSGKAIDTAVRA